MNTLKSINSGKVYLDLNITNWLHNKVTTSDKRIFGSMIPNKNDPTKVNVIIESIHLCPKPLIKIGKKTCDHKIYSRILFHTHPTGSIIYPSANDIIFLNYNKKVLSTSIIATSIGIWILTNNYINPNSVNANAKNEIQQQLNKIINFNTASNNYAILNDIIMNISKIMDMNIDFYPWVSLNNNFVKILINF